MGSAITPIKVFKSLENAICYSAKITGALAYLAPYKLAPTAEVSSTMTSVRPTFSTPGNLSLRRRDVTGAPSAFSKPGLR